MIRIVIVEDFHIVREGICKLLQESKDFDVVGQAENGLDALELVRKLRPDVLVLDISMPNMDGIEVLTQIKNLDEHPKVVILSMYADSALVEQALGLGALGYVLKQSISDELLDAVRAAYRGSGYLSAGVSHILTNQFTKKQSTNPLDHLSPRECEVVRRIVAGFSTKEIASELRTSVKTVEKQRRDAMRKLEVDNVASLVRVCLELGMHDYDSD